MWNGHIKTLGWRRDAKFYFPVSIDVLKKYSNFQSFSYIRVCFTLTGIIWELLIFDWVPFHFLTEKRLLDACMFCISHQDLTIRRCDDTKLSFRIACAEKKVPPAIYVHVHTFYTFFEIFTGKTYFTPALHPMPSLQLIVTSDCAVLLRKIKYIQIHHALFYRKIYLTLIKVS